MDSAIRQQLLSKLAHYFGAGTDCLTPSQRAAQHEVIRKFYGGRNYGLIKRPTGTGKNVQAIATMEAFDAPSVTVVPRKNLVDQVRDKITDPLYNFRIKPAEIGVYDSNRSLVERHEALDRKHLVTTYASFIKLLREGAISFDPRNPRYRPVINLDEVHRTRGEGIRPVIQSFLDECFVLGWTASDTFMDGSTVSKVIFRNSSPLHVTTVQDAVEGGELCAVKNIVVDMHIDNIDEFEGSGDYTQKQLNKIAGLPGRDQNAVRMHQHYVDPETGLRLRDMGSIWYCCNVDHAENVAERLTNLYGENYALAVSGMTPKKDLRDILEMHRRGRIPALVCADLLIEGFDSVFTQLCMMLRPTRSPIVAEQTGGRVLRADRHNPNKVAYIITFRDENMKDLVCFGHVAKGMVFAPRGSSLFKRVLHQGPQEITPHRPRKIIPRKFREYKELPQLEFDGIEIHATHEELLALYNQYTDFKKARDEINRGWLTKTALIKRIEVGSRNKAFMSFWADIEGKCPKDNSNFGYMLKSGRILRVGYREIAAGRYRLAVFADEETIAAIQNEVGIVPLLPDDKWHWPSLTRFLVEYCRNKHRNNEAQILKDFLKKLESEKDRVIEIDGAHYKPRDIFGYYRKYPGLFAYYINPISLGFILKELNWPLPLPDDGKKRLALTDMSRKLFGNANWKSTNKLKHVASQLMGNPGELIKLQVGDVEQEFSAASVVGFYNAGPGAHTFYFVVEMQEYLRKYFELPDKLPKEKHHFISDTRIALLASAGHSSPEYKKATQDVIEDVKGIGTARLKNHQTGAEEDVPAAECIFYGKRARTIGYFIDPRLQEKYVTVEKIRQQKLKNKSAALVASGQPPVIPQEKCHLISESYLLREMNKEVCPWHRDALRALVVQTLALGEVELKNEEGKIEKVLTDDCIGYYSREEKPGAVYFFDRRIQEAYFPRAAIHALALQSRLGETSKTDSLFLPQSKQHWLVPSIIPRKLGLRGTQYTQAAEHIVRQRYKRGDKEKTGHFLGARGRGRAAYYCDPALVGTEITREDIIRVSNQFTLPEERNEPPPANYP